MEEMEENEEKEEEEEEEITITMQSSTTMQWSCTRGPRELFPERGQQGEWKGDYNCNLVFCSLPVELYWVAKGIVCLFLSTKQREGGEAG